MSTSTTIGEHPTHCLDRVIWSALTTHQARLCEGGPTAKRFLSDYAPFAATADDSDDALDALQRLLAPGEDVALFTDSAMDRLKQCEVLLRKDLLQMIVLPERLPAAPAMSVHAPRRLRAIDVSAMRALVDLTKPGPFRTRTHELGTFWGIFVGDRLAAITGQRMHVPGFREVTAVCTHPDFRGLGLARRLVISACEAIIDQGEIPFLHVYSDNRAAISVYEQLGFAIHQSTQAVVVRKHG